MAGCLALAKAGPMVCESVASWGVMKVVMKAAYWAVPKEGTRAATKVASRAAKKVASTAQS